MRSIVLFCSMLSSNGLSSPKRTRRVIPESYPSHRPPALFFVLPGPSVQQSGLRLMFQRTHNHFQRPGGSWPLTRYAAGAMQITFRSKPTMRIIASLPHDPLLITFWLWFSLVAPDPMPDICVLNQRTCGFSAGPPLHRTDTYYVVNIPCVQYTLCGEGGFGLAVKHQSGISVVVGRLKMRYSYSLFAGPLTPILAMSIETCPGWNPVYLRYRPQCNKKSNTINIIQHTL